MGFTLLDIVKKWFPTVRKVWADNGYQGFLVDWFYRYRPRKVLEIIRRKDKGFKILPRRWIVERTFGWFNGSRRLSKDYETLPESSETLIMIAMIRIMLARLK